MTYREIPKNPPIRYATKYSWVVRQSTLNPYSINMDRLDWCSYHCSWCGWQIEPQYEDYFSSDSYHAHEYCHNKHCYEVKQ